MKKFNVLLVDDDEDDRMLFKEAFMEVAHESSIVLINDGRDLLLHLSNNQSVMPDVLFLDLNMPFVNGYKCLEEIRKNKSMKDIFIVMNSTTASQQEINRVYESGANLFLIKPSSFNVLKQSIRMILDLDFQNLAGKRMREHFVFNPESPSNRTN